jgi:16S rRNA (guanine527-N7)-methyltransferase
MEIVTKYFSDFSAKQLSQLEQLKDLYATWNAQINVISRKDIDELYQNHVLHSMAIATQFEFLPQQQIMDLGCGGGFPGIPLAILYPDTQFLMVDSINKKLKVVQEVANAIGLTNITIRHGRAEEIKDKTFDYVVSRAVAPLLKLWQWSGHLINKKGELKNANNTYNGLICLKGGDLTQEIAESGLRPLVWNIEGIYREPYFKEKYILFVPKK